MVAYNLKTFGTCDGFYCSVRARLMFEKDILEFERLVNYNCKTCKYFKPIEQKGEAK